MVIWAVILYCIEISLFSLDLESMILIYYTSVMFFFQMLIIRSNKFAKYPQLVKWDVAALCRYLSHSQVINTKSKPGDIHMASSNS